MEWEFRSGVCFHDTNKAGRGWEQVLFPNLSDRICGCWWLMRIPGSPDSSVGMRTPVDYGIRDSVYGIRWVTGPRVWGQKGQTRDWVTVTALSLEQSCTPVSWVLSEHQLVRVSILVVALGPRERALHGMTTDIYVSYQYDVYSTSKL